MKKNGLKPPRLSGAPWPLKVTAIFTAFIFTWNQILWADPAVTYSPDGRMESMATRIPETETPPRELPDYATDEQSIEFMMQAKALQLAEIEANENVRPEEGLAALSRIIRPTRIDTLQASDGTMLTFQGRSVIRETRTNGVSVDYKENGEIKTWTQSGAYLLDYLSEESIKIKKQDGTLIYQVGAGPLVLPSAQALLTYQTFENGMKGYYQNGVFVEIRTASGIRIVDFELTSTNDFRRAWLIYPDDTQEFVWEGKVLRRITSDGTVTDFTPDGLIVREKIANETQTYQYQKNAQNQIVTTTVVSSSGLKVVYDDKGLLKAIYFPNGGYLKYKRFRKGSRWYLERMEEYFPEGTPADRGSVVEEAWYDSEARPESILFQDGRQIEFESGRISRVTDAQGNLSSFEYLFKDGLPAGLSIQRGESMLHFDSAGQLSQIENAAGVLDRQLTGSPNAGTPADADLFLGISGGTVSEFELNDDGSLKSGFLDLESGMRLRIENGVTVGFETQDGRFYKIEERSGKRYAVLQNWNVPGDFTVSFDGSALGRILYPDSTALLPVISPETGELTGFQRDLGKGILAEYNLQGKAVSLRITRMNQRVADVEVFQIRWENDSAGTAQKIHLESSEHCYSFSPAGAILSAGCGDVRAEYAQGVITKITSPFGEILAPQWNNAGALTGEAVLIDGTRHKIENGVITQTLRTNGTKIFYVQSRIRRIETANAIYELDYPYPGTTGDIEITVRRDGQSRKYPLAFFMAHPETDQPEPWQESAPHPAYASGNTQIVEGEGVFGGAVYFDGDKDYLDITDSEDWNFGAQDFSVDFWFKPESLDHNQQLMSWDYETGSALNGISLSQNGSLTAFLGAAVRNNDIYYHHHVELSTLAGSVKAGEWHHAALVRKGDQVILFLDGKEAARKTFIYECTQSSSPLRIGATRFGPYTDDFHGWIDEFRVSREGVARWTSDFVKPTEPADANLSTALLLHFDSDGSLNPVIHDEVKIHSDRLTAEKEIEEIRSILFSRPLETLENSDFQISTPAGAFDLSLMRTSEDPERGEVFEISGAVNSEWTGVNFDPSWLNGGYPGLGEHMDADDHMPGLTATLTDMNGDGLSDRVYLNDTLDAGYWWVQMNNGTSFDAPVKWTGVNMNADPSVKGFYRGTFGTLRYYEGRHPHVMGDLVDLNGDHRPDRLMHLYRGESEWLVQFNEGNRFGPTVVWGGAKPQAASQGSPEGTYSSEVRNDLNGKNVQELIADLIDLDGDGLVDRVVRPNVPPYTQWFFQKNTGTGFADSVLWSGVNTDFDPDVTIAASLSWYDHSEGMADLSRLEDINGDKRPDRLLAKSSDPSNRNSALVWYVQMNSGNGFDAAGVFDSSLRSAAGAPTQRLGTSLRYFAGESSDRSVQADLFDVTGDGILDRITVDKNGDVPSSVWWVEIGTGKACGLASAGEACGFKTAERWVGIYGTTAQETAITQDTQNFYSWHCTEGQDCGPGRTPSAFSVVADLKDMNGDKIPDRVVFSRSQNQWIVQLGTGRGFLPVGDRVLEGATYSLDTGAHSAVYEAASQPLHGTLLLNPDGTFSYTPKPGYSGSDSFVYRILEKDGRTSLKTKYLNVSEPSYVFDTLNLSSSGSTAVSSTQYFAQSFQTGDETRMLDALTLSMSAAENSAGNFFVEIYDAEGSEPGERIGTLNGSENPEAAGSYVYRAQEPVILLPDRTYFLVFGVRSGAGVYHLQQTAQVPMIGSSAGTGSSQNRGTGWTLLAQKSGSLQIEITDRASHFLEAVPGVAQHGALVSQEKSGRLLSYRLISPPSHGTVTLQAGGNFTYTAEAGYEGQDSFRYEVTDGIGAPRAESVPIYVSLAGHSFSTGSGFAFHAEKPALGESSGTFSGTNSFLSLPDDSDWSLGSGNFTMDLRAKFSSLPEPGKYAALVSQWEPGQKSYGLFLHNDAGTYKLAFYYSQDGTSVLGSSFAISAPNPDTWYHLAAVKSGSDLKIYLNGTQVGSTLPLTGITFLNSSASLMLGAAGTGSAHPFIGSLDEVRISSTARWTSNFTPPAGEYAHDSATRLLLHFSQKEHADQREQTGHKPSAQILPVDQPLQVQKGKTVEASLRPWSLLDIEDLIPGLAATPFMYNTLHAGFKAGRAISAAEGYLEIRLLAASGRLIQSWQISNLSADWQDFDLSIDSTTQTPARLEVRLLDSQGRPLNVPVYTDGFKLAALRPEDASSWMNSLLIGSGNLNDLTSASSLTLQNFISPVALDVDAYLAVLEEAGFFEKISGFEYQMELPEGSQDTAITTATTISGDILTYQGNQVIGQRFSDGTEITFQASDPDHPGTSTQTITREDGTSETLTSGYGRVRSVSRPDITLPDGTVKHQAPLEYSYEFVTSDQLSVISHQSTTDHLSLITDNSGLVEVTIVFDPDSGEKERYAQGLLIERISANGVSKKFFYDSKNELSRTEIYYKNRRVQTFFHETAASGRKILITESGVREEYDGDRLAAYTTPEGFRYELSEVQATRIQNVTLQPERIDLPGGGFITVQVPYLSVSTDSCTGDACELLTQIRLTSYTSASGDHAEFGGAGVLESVSLTDGTIVHFEKIKTEETFNETTNQLEVTRELDEVSVLALDGTVTRFKNGEPFEVVSRSGVRVDLRTTSGALRDPSDGARFHFEQAKKLWNEVVLVKWNEFQLSGSQEVLVERDKDGVLLTRQYAEGSIELYEEGKISQILSASGESMVVYSYDADGNPVKIDMAGARRQLRNAILKLEAEVAANRQEAILNLAEREAVLGQTIRGEYEAIRSRLLAVLSKIQAQSAVLRGMSIKGKQGRETLGEAHVQIQLAESQVYGALGDLRAQTDEALENLDTQMKEAVLDIEEESAATLTQIRARETDSLYSILIQENMPVITHWYRKILGRGPSQTEVYQLLGMKEVTVQEKDAQGQDVSRKKFEYSTSVYLDSVMNLKVDKLKTDLEQSSERSARAAEVSAVKAAVSQALKCHAGILSGEAACPGNLNLTQFLGLSGNLELVNLTREEVTKILEWLDGRSLDFGQCAFASLEALLEQSAESIAQSETCSGSDAMPHALCAMPRRVSLASRLILTDILTGVITPLENAEQELLISFHAMRLVAKSYGLELHGYAMSFEALKEMFRSACPQGLSPTGTVPSCNFRVVVQVDGDHFIIVTGIEEVRDPETGKVIEEIIHYQDPGTGPEGAREILKLSRQAFEAKWTLGPGSPWAGKGFVLSAEVVPPSVPAAQYSALTTHDQMRVRGGFFFFLIPVIMAVIGAVVAAVSAVVAAIVTLVAGLMAAIGSFLTGIGTFFSSLFAGNFIAAFQGLMTGVVNGLMGIGTAFVNAAAAFQTTLIGGLGLQNTFLAPFLSSGFVTSSLVGLELQGVTKLLDAVGVSPKFMNTLSNGLQIATGIGMLATGNPMGLGFIAGGTSNLLSQYTNLSPVLNNILSLSAAAVGAFASGAFGAGGTIGAGIAALKTAVPALSMELASTGLMAVGNALGMDPRISSFINVPLRMAVGGFALGATTSAGILDSIKGALFSPQSMAGFVSVGASWALDAAGAPVFAQGLVQGFLSEFAKSVPGQTLFGKIGEGLRRFTGWAANGVGAVIDFGAKALNGAAQMTAAGFRNAIDFFSGAFSRDTQDALYQEKYGLRQGTVSVNGNVWTWQSGSTRIDYNTASLEVTNTSDLSGTAKIGGLGQDALGNTTYRNLNFEHALEDGRMVQRFENGKFVGWSYESNTGEILTVSGNPDGFSNGQIRDGEISFQYQDFHVTDDLDPLPTLQETGWTLVRFDIAGGRASNTQVEYHPGTGNTQNTDSTTSEGPLYALVNGIGEHQNGNNVVSNLETDLSAVSSGQIQPRRDTINSDPFSGNFFGSAGSAFDKAEDVINWIRQAQSPLAVGVAAARIIADFTIHYFMRQQDQTKPIVGMGYSGGFLPLVTAILNQHYNGETLVGLGAATAIMDLSEQEWQTVLGYVQSGAFGLASAFVSNRSSVIPSLTNSSVKQIVNIWGTEDVLADLGVSGYRPNIGGFTPTDNNHRLINIEIVGADHFDYMRRSDADAWNLTVSDFVAKLLVASKTEEGMRNFLDGQSLGIITRDFSRNGTYIVTLPGHP